MPDWHYHANHIDGPPRGSKRAAMKDARRLHVQQGIYDGTVEVNYDYRPTGLVEWPLIVKCFRTDCTIQREKVVAQRER